MNDIEKLIQESESLQAVNFAQDLLNEILVKVEDPESFHIIRKISEDLERKANEILINMTMDVPFNN